MLPGFCLGQNFRERQVEQRDVLLGRLLDLKLAGELEDKLADGGVVYRAEFGEVGAQHLAKPWNK